MLPSIVGRAQEALQLLEIRNGRPIPDGSAKVWVRRPAFTSHDLPHILYLMLGQLELLDSKGETKRACCVEGPSTCHHVVDQRLTAFRVLLLQVLLVLHIVLVRRDLRFMDFCNPILILNQMEHLLDRRAFSSIGSVARPFKRLK